jgi:hypothetical protein
MKYLSSLLILLMFLSCENGPDQEKETSKVQFSFSNEVRTKASAADAKSIVISIEQSGTPVYDKANLTLFDFNGTMVTTPLALPIGNYSITEFFVLDSLDSVIFATPLEGSVLANLVTDPLPIEFTVSSNQTVVVSPQVISTESNNPGDFGFFGLGFGIVETFDFLVSVQIFENGAFTPTAATVDVESDGHLDYSQTIPNTITTIKTRDIAAGTYTVTISKAGYEVYNQNFTRDSLLTFAATPLIVVLNETSQLSATDLTGQWMITGASAKEWTEGNPTPIIIANDTDFVGAIIELDGTNNTGAFILGTDTMPFLTTPIK